MSADVAAPVVDELRVPESPEKRDFTRLANDRSEGADVVAAGAPPPDTPPDVEHAETVAATIATQANIGPVRHHAFLRSHERDRKKVAFLELGGVMSAMRKACQSGDLHAARVWEEARRSDSVLRR
jgi:hypothetical protein